MKDFRNLKVWEKGHKLTLAVYKCTLDFPKEELYGLISQMRRSAASIPSNIAEGTCRTDNELGHFLQIAMGSASELEYQLLLAHDLSYLDDRAYLLLSRDVVEIKQMLSAFIKKLRADR